MVTARNGWTLEAREAIANGCNDHRWTRAEMRDLKRELAAVGVRKGDRVHVFGIDGRPTPAIATVMGWATRPIDRGGTLLWMLDRDRPGVMDETGVYAWMIQRADDDPEAWTDDDQDAWDESAFMRGVL